MSTLWMTSDTHFGHKNRMPEDRDFDSIEEHDETLIERWNKRVKRDDIVIHLGDVGLARDSYILECVARLNGHKHLITGNHDAVWPGHRDSHKHQAKWMGPKLFESVQAYGRRRIGSANVVLSHLPYFGDHTDKQRYGEWRLPNMGELLFHGHVHDKWLVNENQINVGVDVWKLRPVMFDELVEFAKGLGLL